VISIISISFTIIIALSVLVIVWTKNVVHATYALALVLVLMAGLFVTLQAELLAVVQILLYAGGVVILLIFGVMMTQRKDGKPISASRNPIIPSMISIALFIGLVKVISGLELSIPLNNKVSQIRQIGIAFLTDHLVAFELIAFILLVALVGAAYLAKTSTDHGD